MPRSSSKSLSQRKGKKSKKDKKIKRSRSRSKKDQIKKTKKKSRSPQRQKQTYSRERKRSPSRDRRRSKSKQRDVSNSRERERAKRKQQERLARARALKFEKFSSDSEKEDEKIEDNIQDIEEQIQKAKQIKQQQMQQQEEEINEPPGLNNTDWLEEGDEDKVERMQEEEEQDEEDKLAIEEERLIETYNKSNSNANQVEIKQEIMDDSDILDQFMKGISGNAVAQVDDRPSEQIDQSKIITIDDIMNNNNSNEEGGGETDDEDDEYYEKFKQEMKKKDEIIKKADFASDDDELEDFDWKKYEVQEQTADDYLQKIQKKTETKELIAVDHCQINYSKFRKNFYIESKEILDMAQAEVDEYRKKLGDIVVRGKDVPRPVKNWYQCGLSDLQLKILKDVKKYENPFAIQCQCLPIIMSGRDTIGIAETGSGKTMAYLLPMIRHVADQPKLADGEGPIAIVFAPTRELADQIWREIKVFGKYLGINSVCVYGGAGIQGQLSELRKGCEIVICTPGRLIDILTISNGRIMNLKRVTYIVIDEADRMLDQGFEPQLTRILQNCRPDRQTVMFSATFPRNVENLARTALIRPIEVIVGSRGQACKNITQIIEVRDETTKLRRLLEILGDWQEKGSVLIFVDKQTEADELFKELLKYGHPSLLLHGAIDATDREFTIRDFKKQVLNIMVATSVCARGLDIPHISLVINFQCPNHMEDYVHRIGRTGRAGKSGTAITFVTPQEDQYSMDLQKAVLMSGQPISTELADLVKQFKKKIEQGEARIHVNKNLLGQGYKFDNDETSRIEATKNAIKKRFSLENNIEDEDSDSGEIFVKTQKRSENMKERSVNQKLAMIKDPSKRQAIMQEGFKAAQQALLQGMPQDKVLQEASNAIKVALNQYNPIRSLDQTIEDAAKLLDQFDRTEQENSDVVIYDYDINDYPSNARSKVMHRELLQTMFENYGCTVSIRGQHVEIGKKAPPGTKPLHLRIEGDTKYAVTSCYKELKKVAEEAALRNLSITNAPAGKFNV